MDETLRLQTLRAAVRDSTFLKNCWDDIQPEIFPTREEQTIARLALDFYGTNKEAIGSLLRSDTEEVAAAQRFGAESKQKLRGLVDRLLGPKMEPISIKALEERVKRLKRLTFYENAVNEILTAQEKGELTADILSNLVHRAGVELSSNGHVSSYYTTELEKRIERRRRAALKKWPLYMIAPLDKRIKGLGRGRLGLVMAPPKGGKGLMLVWLTGALALQGFNVLHLTLEDPIALVEDRLDASLTGLPLNKLNALPNKLRRKFGDIKSKISSHIRIIENLESNLTVPDVERLWEHERKNGFIADAIVIDYDEFIQPTKANKEKRFEIEDIYTRLKELAAKLNVILWTAGQTTRNAEDARVIKGKHTAESYTKIRRCFIALGIGSDSKDKKLKYLNVMVARESEGDILIPIMSDFASALIYDTEATAQYEARVKAKAAAERGKKESA